MIGVSGNTSIDWRAFSLRTDVKRLLGDTKFIFDSASDYIASQAHCYFEGKKGAEDLRGDGPEDGRRLLAEGNGLELLEGGEFDGEKGNDHIVKVEDRGGEIHIRAEWLVFHDTENQIEAVFQLVRLTMWIGSGKRERGRLKVNRNPRCHTILIGKDFKSTESFSN